MRVIRSTLSLNEVTSLLLIGRRKKKFDAKRIELTRFLNSLNSLLTTIRGGQQVV